MCNLTLCRSKNESDSKYQPLSTKYLGLNTNLSILSNNCIGLVIMRQICAGENIRIFNTLTGFGFVFDDVLSDGAVAVLTRYPAKFYKATAFLNDAQVSWEIRRLCN
jgi:hypothetical protein